VGPTAQELVEARVADEERASGCLGVRGEKLLFLIRVRHSKPRTAGFEQRVGYEAGKPYSGTAGIGHEFLKAYAVRQYEDRAVAVRDLDVLAGGEDEIGRGVTQLIPGHDPASGVMEQVEDPSLKAEAGSWAKTTETRLSSRTSAGRHLSTRTVEVTVRAATTNVFSARKVLHRRASGLTGTRRGGLARMAAPNSYVRRGPKRAPGSRLPAMVLLSHLTPTNNPSSWHRSG
jgi:hypothetical protein